MELAGRYVGFGTDNWERMKLEVVGMVVVVGFVGLRTWVQKSWMMGSPKPSFLLV